LKMMMKRDRAHRPGFTLVEILVVFTILGIVGVMLVRILLTQSRFTDQQNALSGARRVSRQAMNVLESELRMVQDSGGIDSASTDGKTIRVLVPYRFGLNCGVSPVSLTNVVSMLPVDSVTLAQARYAGYGWRSQSGTYTTVPMTSGPVLSTDAAQCTGVLPLQANIRTLTLNGRAGQVYDVRPVQPLAPKGQAVFFYQRITYTFKASTAFPGQYGLFRTVQMPLGGISEELMAPFDSTARFKYWTRSATASVAAPPALPLIRGIDVVFAARSSYAPIGKTAPSKSTVVASIFFKNVR
jgi:prepilin-type N-terminal cleavage/methylation domain-containing protein